jgi:hypothetical protein
MRVVRLRVEIVIVMVVLVLGASAGCWVLVLGAGAGCWVLAHRELGRRYAGSQNSIGADLVPGDSQAPERALQLVEWQASINERPEHHVAGNPGEAIEVQQAHSRPISLRSRYRP